jgi:hypothetical protein
MRIQEHFLGMVWPTPCECSVLAMLGNSLSAQPKERVPIAVMFLSKTVLTVQTTMAHYAIEARLHITVVPCEHLLKQEHHGEFGLQQCIKRLCTNLKASQNNTYAPLRHQRMATASEYAAFL